ncbi:DNA-3-methyladenine glycosylase I [Methanococcoides methylutens]|uniref:DNA-3-methyladenine glycosylase I n=1 Tax=Methanococcoides methylutens TaxID=2226 RepID=UPI0009E0310A|nr:DNA-3-methyladenine glycosylase I [Methanococcoides methylutens]
MKLRCEWANANDLEIEYHDKHWGVPVHDDRTLFEFLILEGAQAGLSWDSILKRRESYKEAFDDFDFNKIAAYDDAKVGELMQNSGIIRNRRKILSSVNYHPMNRVASCFILFSIENKSTGSSRSSYGDDYIPIKFCS